MTMRMKNPVIVVTCVLLLSSLSVPASPKSFDPAECCFDFSPHRPRNMVVDFKHTHKNCPKKGVLFVRKNGGKFCVDPTVTWVKEIIEAKMAKRQKSVHTSRSTGK